MPDTGAKPLPPPPEAAGGGEADFSMRDGGGAMAIPPENIKL